MAFVYMLILRRMVAGEIFLNAFCKLCDIKPEIRQPVACEMHIRAQTMDLTANGPSNDGPNGDLQIGFGGPK